MERKKGDKCYYIQTDTVGLNVLEGVVDHVFGCFVFIQPKEGWVIQRHKDFVFSSKEGVKQYLLNI